MDIRRWIVLAIMPCLLAPAGCMVSPKVLTEQEIRSQIAQDLNGLAQDVEPLAGPIDLYEAMARTLKHNLDVKVEVMHQMLAHQQLDLSHYSLLPRLVANAGYDGRNNFTGGVSRSLITGQQTLEPSTSADRAIFGSDLTLSSTMLEMS
jgi:outer membrane protein TolC